METSTLNGANGTRAHGIVPLSMKEIEMVAGAKASSPPPKSIWEKLMNWFSGGDPVTTNQTLPAPPPGVFEACIAAGATFTYEYSTGGGFANLSFVRAGGDGTTLRINCVPNAND